HVPPPVAPPGTPGEYLAVPPAVGDDGGIAGPIGLGPRVPTLVISPWSRNTGARSDPGWRPLVCSDTLDHTSHMRFLERLFAAKGAPGIALPNDTAWRQATPGGRRHAAAGGPTGYGETAPPGHRRGRALPPRRGGGPGRGRGRAGGPAPAPPTDPADVAPRLGEDRRIQTRSARSANVGKHA